MDNGSKMMTNGDIVSFDEVKSSRNVEIRAQALTFNLNALNDGFEIFNYPMDNMPEQQIILVGQIEPINEWSHVLGQQNLNNLIGNWLYQSMPPGNILGMLITYVSMGRAAFHWTNTVVQ